MRTTFASGNRYQPLPTHDEAWQAYGKIYTDTTIKRHASDTLKYRVPPVKITDAELLDAARQGFFGDMPRSLHRRLYLMLPPAERARIKQLPEDQALAETRKHYET